MTDDTMAAAPSEPAEPAIVADATDFKPETLPNLPEVEVEVADGDADPEAEDQPEPEYDTVEIDGKSYQVPRDLKDGYLRQADYTRKTQEVADRRRELEERSASLDQRSQVTEDDLRDRAAQLHIDQELTKYQNVDWAALQQQDPMGFQQHRLYFEQLRDAKVDTEKRISEREATRSQEAQQDLAKRFGETRAAAEREFKGWTPEIGGKVLDFVKEQGVDAGTIDRLMSPEFYRVAHLAYIGHQALSKKPAAPTTPVKPLETVTARSSPPARGDLAAMSMEDFVKARERGVGG